MGFKRDNPLPTSIVEWVSQEHLEATIEDIKSQSRQWIPSIKGAIISNSTVAKEIMAVNGPSPRPFTAIISKATVLLLLYIPPDWLESYRSYHRHLVTIDT